MSNISARMLEYAPTLGRAEKPMDKFINLTYS